MKFFFSFEIRNISAELEVTTPAVVDIFDPLAGGNNFRP
jgi:hypothetical protein